MAYTYASVPNLSKVKIGSTTYFLKDADVRTILDSFNNAIVTGTITNTLTDEDKFAYSSTIKAYIDSAVSVGIVVEVVSELPTASADTMGKIYMISQSGGKTGDYYNEYITVKGGTTAEPTYNWEQIGDTRIDLSNYYTKTETETIFEQKANLKSFAYADSASGNIAATVAASGAYTPAGNVTVNELNQTATAATLTKGDYTPAGTVSITGDSSTVKVLKTNGTLGSAASFTQGLDYFDEGALPSIDTNEFNGGDLTDVSVILTEGSVELDGLNAQIHVEEGFLYGGSFPAFTQGTDTFSAGTLPSKAADTFTAGTLPTLGNATTGSFATEGMIVSIDTSDSEMLVFGAASTADAVTAQGTFSQGTLPSFSEGAFTQGTLPSFTQGSDTYNTADANFPYVSESDIWAEVNGNVNYTSQEVSSITFEFTPASVGSEFLNPGVLPSFSQGSDEFTTNTPTTLATFEDATVLTDASATFTGSTASSVLVTSVSYDKATANGGSFAGTSATIEVSGTATGSVTVTADSE